MTPFQDSSMPAFIPMSSSPGGDPRLSPFKGFARSYSADPNIPLPVYLRQYHKDAYNHISKALSIDEEGGDVESKRKAIEAYKEGIIILRKGLALELRGEGPDWERSRVLQQKMRENLDYCTARLEALKSTLRRSEEVLENIPKKGVSHTARKHLERKLSLESSQVLHSSARSPEKRRQSFTSPRTFDRKDEKSNQVMPIKGCLSPRGHLNPSGLKRNHTLPKRPLSRSHSSPKPNEEEKAKSSKMKNVDSKMANTILNELLEKSPGVAFSDIGGIDNAKRTLQEIVVLPSLRPELFTGLRAPAKGVLLFGPPGNGKTLLAKAVATEASSKFFNISAASLTSKWMGESEKLVRALFGVARELQPSIVFMDEVDSILKERSESEHESSRRLKTEFLLCFDGVTGDTTDRILIMAATNRPWELDDAALRRFVKRVYVPLPDTEARKQILEKLLVKGGSPLDQRDLFKVASETDGYSGSDLAALVQDAALMPLRELDSEMIKSMPVDKVRKLTVEDFMKSMSVIRPSASKESLKQYEEWNKAHGSL